MSKFLVSVMAVALAVPVLAQNDYDDIYYNPNQKTGKNTTKTSKKTSKSNYVADFSDMDVDEYNKRGFYYETPVDTIGNDVASEEDFVYTQQIQKYYNPTIVVDNASALSEVLENSYGNVDITVYDGRPVFTSVYTGAYGWAPSYYNWSYVPSWSWNYGWGPGYVSYSPVWGWSVGVYSPYVSWGYGPTWGWGYDPAWSYYPHYHHHHHDCRPPRPYGNSYHRPGGATRPVNAGTGWSSARRPGTSGNVMHRASASKYVSNSSASRPGSSITSRGNGQLQGKSQTLNRSSMSKTSGTVSRNITTSREVPSTGRMNQSNRESSLNRSSSRSVSTQKVAEMQLNNAKANSASKSGYGSKSSSVSKESKSSKRSNSSYNRNTSNTSRSSSNYNRSSMSTNRSSMSSGRSSGSSYSGAGRSSGGSGRSGGRR